MRPPAFIIIAQDFPKEKGFSDFYQKIIIFSSAATWAVYASGERSVTTAGREWTITIKKVEDDPMASEDLEPLTFTGNGDGYIEDIDLPWRYYQVTFITDDGNHFHVKFGWNASTHECGIGRGNYLFAPTSGDAGGTPVQNGDINILDISGVLTVSITESG